MAGKHKVGVPITGKHRDRNRDPRFVWVAKVIDSVSIPKPKPKVPTPTEEEQIEAARRVRMRLLENRHQDRLRSYDYIGSPAHLDELNDWITDRTHEDIRPPWEDD